MLLTVRLFMSPEIRMGEIIRAAIPYGIADQVKFLGLKVQRSL